MVPVGNRFLRQKISDEVFNIKYDAPIYLSMENSGKNTNGSQFSLQPWKPVGSMESMLSSENLSKERNFWKWYKANFLILWCYRFLSPSWIMVNFRCKWLKSLFLVSIPYYYSHVWLHATHMSYLFIIFYLN